MDEKHGYYIVLISIHGLIRGDHLELGRDSDTGGQTKYVVELARALGEHPDVEQVDLLTRLVKDKQVSDDYAKPIEELSENARIVRISCGPAKYLYKESLWPYLDEFAGQTAAFFQEHGRTPDVVHGHYADAGYVSSLLGTQLDVPVVFTGHSLGRIKRQRLLGEGMELPELEERYHFERRIEAEETALEHASIIVTSTTQEVEEQYANYRHYRPNHMVVIPPGTDLEHFKPPTRPEIGTGTSAIYEEISSFLDEPDKPVILIITRPDHRKNITALVEAYGENKELQEAANLVMYMGIQEKMETMDESSRDVVEKVFALFDQYDLKGKVAYPKNHDAEDIPYIYRLAVQSQGVFVNPALTEPFGLTLIEAAASGLPIVATNDGGPNDIIKNCNNGFLIDPLDSKGMGEKIHEIISNKKLWKKFSRSGITRANRYYHWNKHVRDYLKVLKQEMKKRK